MPGFALFVPTVIMILLAIQWGGSRYSWGSATIIGLFCGFGGLLLVFMYWQWRKGDEASIPPNIIAQRTVLASAMTGAFSMGALQLMVVRTDESHVGLSRRSLQSLLDLTRSVPPFALSFC